MTGREERGLAVSRTETETAVIYPFPTRLADLCTAFDSDRRPIAAEILSEIAKLYIDSLALEAARQEVEHLRDRAVCSGCGQDVAESGACDTAGCDSGEVIPASDLPSALHAAMELRNDVRVDTNEELEAARQETVEAHRIIDRIWCELGNPSYEELAGRTIYDRVAAGMAAESELAGLRETVGALSELVDEQAEDEALWSVYPFGEQPIAEAYLQQELRKLHAAVEAARLRGSQETN